MTRWQKLGRIFVAAGQRDWMKSHSACPMPLDLGNGYFRIYFGTRDARNRPRIGYLVVHMNDPRHVLELSESPVLEPGPWGYFDDNGVYPGCLVKDGKRLLMYYLGRSNGEPPLYTMAIGLAESWDGGLSFKRVMPSPVVGRGPHDPWMVSTPWILHEASDQWRMWYLSGIGWESIERDVSLYHVKYAESTDGLDWRRDGLVALDIIGDETNLASPCVWNESGEYRALFCVAARHGGYRLGEAWSKDGLSWQRLRTPNGLGLSSSGWDSKCMAYPSTFEYDGRRFVLYSGNGNGRDGFGIAIAEESAI